MPRAPKHCGKRGCTTLVTGRPYCPTHAAEQRATSTWGRGSTRQSRRERTLILQRHPRCYLQYDGCTTISTQDDHVIPVYKGGTDHLSNRRGACDNCHGIKSRAEAAEAHYGHATPHTQHR